MDVLKQFVVFLVTFVCFGEVLGLTNVNEVACYFNPKHGRGGFCKIFSPRGSMKYINIGCYIFKPLNNVMLKMVILRKTNNRYLPVGKPSEQDLCHFENIKSDSYFFNRIMLQAAKTMGVKCPVQGNVTYPRLPCIMHFAQGFFPVGDYILNCKVNEKRELFIDLNLTFTIKQKDFF